MHVKATVENMTYRIETESCIPQQMIKETKKKYKGFQSVRLDAMEPECSIPMLTAIKTDGRWKTW
jgi:hypothetical protein